MVAQQVVVGAVESDEKWFYRVGGIAAFILVLGWFLAFPLYAAGGGLEPHGAEARLLHYMGRESAWWGILVLMVFTDLLYVGIALALYQCLKKVDQGLMLLFIACKGLFFTLDLGLLWPNHAALFNLSSLYAAAASEAQRATIVGAAVAPTAMLDSLLPTIYSIVLPSLGTLFAGLAMLKGGFSKRVAYLGLIVGVTGIVAVVDPFMGSLGQMHVVNALLAAIWWLLVGYKLYKLGQ